MTNHGFGGGKLQSNKASLPTQREIAKCISNVPGVVWAHVVHKGVSYFCALDEKIGRKRVQEVQDRYDFIFEMARPCDLEEVAACAKEKGHGIEIDVITIEDESFKKGKPGKHPKED